MSDEPTIPLLIWVRRQDETQTTKRVRLTEDLLREMCIRLEAAPTVREFVVAREMTRHNKSYASDFDPALLAEKTTAWLTEIEAAKSAEPVFSMSTIGSSPVRTEDSAGA